MLFLLQWCNNVELILVACNTCIYSSGYLGYFYVGETSYITLMLGKCFKYITLQNERDFYVNIDIICTLCIWHRGNIRFICHMWCFSLFTTSTTYMNLVGSIPHGRNSFQSHLFSKLIYVFVF